MGIGRHRLRGALMFGCVLGLIASLSCAEQRHPTQPRVPEQHLAEAKGATAPFGDARTANAEVVADGRRLYEGKGSCALCHGTDGKGTGPAAHMQRPHVPRDFTDCAFQRVRTDGELFWTIKYGSPGTGMVPLIPSILDETEGWKLVAYLRTFCQA